MLLRLEPYSSYQLCIKKEGYSLDTLLLSSDELSNPGTYLNRAVFLEPINLHHFLPLALYFDNDAPKPASASQIMPYDRTYQAYYAQKEAYLKGLAAAFEDPEEQDCAAERLEAFFKEEVQAGYLRLEDFAENLDLFLKNEYEVEILIKGFASPLASREYNLALTRRRVLSVKNYLRTVKDGMYNKYLINRRLRITLAPMGESSVSPSISDNYRKKHESVYSVEASRERRAEIIEVRLSKIFPSPDNQISE
jgi:outer membrane protein OmpA-like peptidoglycan-associated protein